MAELGGGGRAGTHVGLHARRRATPLRGPALLQKTRMAGEVCR